MAEKNAYKEWYRRLYQLREDYNFPDTVERVTNEEGRLHNDNGPAFATPTKLEWYKNGRRHGPSIDIFGTILYWYEGVCIPNHYYTNPESVTMDEVLTHTNTEVKYVGMKIVGYDNLKKHPCCKVIHSDKSINSELLKINKIFKDEPVCIVKVVNSTPEPDGTYKDYYLTVPPNMKTCKQAIAWTFYMEEKEYSPSQET